MGERGKGENQEGKRKGEIEVKGKGENRNGRGG